VTLLSKSKTKLPKLKSSHGAGRSVLWGAILFLIVSDEVRSCNEKALAKKEAINAVAEAAAAAYTTFEGKTGYVTKEGSATGLKGCMDSATQAFNVSVRNVFVNPLKDGLTVGEEQVLKVCVQARNHSRIRVTNVLSQPR
jgi:hypothetical protein